MDENRILITGGAGFIGSHLVEHFQGKAEVRVLDNLRTGYRRNLNGFDVKWLHALIGCATPVSFPLAISATALRFFQQH